MRFILPKRFPIINQPHAPISKIYFERKLYMFQAVPLSIVRSFALYTQQWYMSYRFFGQLASRIGIRPDPAYKLSEKPV